MVLLVVALAHFVYPDECHPGIVTEFRGRSEQKRSASKNASELCRLARSPAALELAEPPQPRELLHHCELHTPPLDSLPPLPGHWTTGRWTLVR